MDHHRLPSRHANPPFKVTTWRGELLREDKRQKYGVPPAGNANFA